MPNDRTHNRLDGAAALAAYRNGAILIDVRSEAGRQKNGEVQGAIIISKGDVVETVTKRLTPGAGQKLVLFCGSIKGSEPLVDQLEAEGVRDVYDVDGGFDAITGEDGLRKIERAVS